MRNRVRWAALGLALGLAFAAQAQGPERIAISRSLVREHFGGPGFQAEMFLDTATPEFFDQVLAKRWREMNPRFARLMLHRQVYPDAKPLDSLARQIVFMKETTGTEVYVTGGLKEDAPEGEARQAWARRVAGELEYLFKAGASNLKWHCIANELSLHGFNSMHDDLPTFRSYELALFQELQARKLPIKILATDASPIKNWDTIEWASKNMDDIAGVYRGHHYADDFEPDDAGFYEAFKAKCAWAAGLAKARGKDFIVGEFGVHRYMQLRWGARWRSAKAYGQPSEPMSGLQAAEAVIAAINAGVYAIGYWTFVDYPDERGGATGLNHWGLFRWMSGEAIPRAPYYAYGLMTKFFRGPAAVHQVETGDPLVRVAAIQNEETKTWSIAVVNREARAMPVSVTFPETPDKPFRKYVFDTAHVPVTDDGDLQEFSGKLQATQGKLTDTIAPFSLAVYTTAYHDAPPSPVSGLTATLANDVTSLRWKPNAERDICYYRVFHKGIRIGSTTQAGFEDAGPTRHLPGDYSVVAVDQSGNGSSPQHMARSVARAK